jgi:hypothetical protein
VSLRRPPLHEHHAGAGADLTDFGGWEMPVTFDATRAEHRAVRESVGLFDVSHMGRVGVGGPDARELAGRLTTSDVGSLEAGDAHYACLLREDGVSLDDGGDQVGHVTSGTRTSASSRHAGRDPEYTKRMSFDTPDDLRYTESHEWTADEDGTVRVGITDFAQDELGDIVFVDLPSTGEEFETGDGWLVDIDPDDGEAPLLDASEYAEQIE